MMWYSDSLADLLSGSLTASASFFNFVFFGDFFTNAYERLQSMHSKQWCVVCSVIWCL